MKEVFTIKIGNEALAALEREAKAAGVSTEEFLRTLIADELYKRMVVGPAR